MNSAHWNIDLEARTARRDRQAVQFKPQPVGTAVDAFSVRDVDGVVWRGRFVATSIEITNERERMHTLTAAADAYGKALRKAINPFPADE